MVNHTNDRFLESNVFPFYAAPYELSGGRYVAPHSHEFVEFVYIVEGGGIHTYKGIEHKLRTGDAFVIEPGTEHSYSVGESERLLVYNVLFHPALIFHELERLKEDSSFFDFYYVVPFMRQSVKDQPSLWLSPVEQSALKLLLDEIVREFTVKDHGYRSMIRSKLVECFVFLSRCNRKNNDTVRLASTTEKQAMEQIARFIERHLEKQLKLAEVSRLCGMSVSTFKAKFKANTGRTFLEYRNEMRIMAAKRLLVQTELKMIDIAQEVGFEDVSLFNRTFRHWTGMSPRQYRKDHL
ncbi:helix-turn-helix transcriptional regulator [Paenibacillus aceris]|uniref:AraC family L-rhamnose operon regulatory protein RhaS n=1 Tax=Paenibacillus aceris TaxID=869555 RepID=A0ABS4I6D7_9BACL|nr:AraC family transcriptional regulator [Paenibacillus aceris]MBP1965679.1 AraC family L-rhamnose operon regulatory protein RhaS [Paenibacillus aceris]NHW36392.1 AraC family transcriptional regulator [Paenibacillus aceris]